MASRPAIPAEIRRRVLVEAGHRCAIPTCRNIYVDVHHIIPYEKCQEHTYENLIALCPNCHRMVHEGRIDTKSLLEYKRRLRFAHDKFSQIEIDVLCELASLPPNQGIPWTPYLKLLLKRLFDSGYIVSNDNIGAMIFMNGIQTGPCLIGITDKGRQFFNELNGADGDQIKY